MTQSNTHIDEIWASFLRIDEEKKFQRMESVPTPVSASNHNSESPACSSAHSNGALSDSEVQVPEAKSVQKTPERILNTPSKIMNFIPKTLINTHDKDSVINKDGAPWSQSTSKFSIEQISLNDLNPAADRTILFYECRHFQPVLGKISGQSIVLFIGDNEYANFVKSKLGDPQLKIETRVNALQTLTFPSQEPTNVNSIACIYYIEGEAEKCQPNSDSFFQLIYNRQIALGTFMRIAELARLMQITDPTELLVVNFDPSVARGIFDTAINIGTLRRIQVMSESESDALSLVAKLQEQWNRQLTIIINSVPKNSSAPSRKRIKYNSTNSNGSLPPSQLTPVDNVRSNSITNDVQCPASIRVQKSKTSFPGQKPSSSSNRSSAQPSSILDPIKSQKSKSRRTQLELLQQQKFGDDDVIVIDEVKRRGSMKRTKSIDTDTIDKPVSAKRSKTTPGPSTSIEKDRTPAPTQTAKRSKDLSKDAGLSTVSEGLSVERLRQIFSTPFRIVCEPITWPLTSQKTPSTSKLVGPKSAKRRRFVTISSNSKASKRHSESSKMQLEGPGVVQSPADDNEVAQFCKHCGEITSIVAQGYCGKCAEKKVIPVPRTLTPVSPIPVCGDCKQPRKMFRKGRCRKCYRIFNSTTDDAKLVECVSCKRIKKLFCRGMCCACYRRQYTRSRKSGEPDESLPITVQDDPIANVQELLSFCETTYANTTMDSEIEPSNADMKVEVDTSLEDEPVPPTNLIELIRQCNEIGQ